MRLNRACEAKPVTKRYQRTHIGLRPVVLSVERYDGIVGRSIQKDRTEHLEAIREEQKFKQYLINGNAALVRRFTNMPDITGKNDEELLAARDKALAEATKNMQTKDLLDRRRKERIMRANHLLTMLKPGPRSLHKALIESETIYQRKYHDELNAEIAEEARRQQRLDEQQCPEALIPFGSVSEKQDKAQQLAMAKAARARYLEALEAKRQQKEAEKEQEIFDGIVEREQYKCIQEKEEKQRQELAERRREFCRNAYRDSLNEKQEKARFEAMTDSVEDRIICVNKTAQRHLDLRYNKQVREMREKRFRYLDAFAEKQCQLQLAKQQHLEQLCVKHEQAHNEAQQADELKRRLHAEKLSQERRQYEREYQLHRGEKVQRQAEIRRFELATRLKNENVNRKFKASVKRKQAKEAAELRNILLVERDEFLAQREEELMRISACVEDPYLAEDIKYFADAANAMDDSKARGRPLYPIAKAAEQYRRENQVDMAPQGQVVRRQKIRDYCWPGYVSKAQLAFRKYEHREQCKIEQEKRRRDMFDKCLKITNMAAEERPFKECVAECPMKLMQHRGMPAIESQETIELPYFSCEKPQLPPGPCSPSIKLTATACEKSPLQQELKCAPANNLASDTPSFKSAISKTETVRSLASEQSSLQKTIRHRTSGGRNHSIFTMSPKSAKRPDLTHCWTAPPQAKTKAKNIPVIGSINQKHAANQSPQPFWPAKLKQFD